MRACGVGQSDTARLELIWSSADYGVDTGLAFELSLHGDKVHIALTRNPMSTLVGYIKISREVVAHGIRTLDGHDGWRFIVAASHSGSLCTIPWCVSTIFSEGWSIH